MKIKKGDNVLIIAGKDYGKKGKILQVFPKEKRIMVEGVNLRKKHRKPRKSGEKGQIIILPGSISLSNAKLICSKCGKPTRSGYKIISKIKNQTPGSESEKKEKSKAFPSSQISKVRVCKKCGQET